MINPVTISIIPANSANPEFYKLPNDVPLEDYSLILCRIKHLDKTFELPVMLKNNQLPLDSTQLAGFRKATRDNLTKMLANKAEKVT